MISTKSFGNYLFLVGSIILFIIGCVIGLDGKNATIFAADVLIIVSNTLYSLKCERKKWIFFIFQVTTFTFLMGQSVFCYINNSFSQFELNQYELNLSNVCIWISLFSMRLFYATVNRGEININMKSYDGIYSSNSGYILSIRKISKILFFATYAFLIYALIDKIQFVGNYSYIESYTKYSSPLSLVASRFSSLSIPALYVFLGTMPEKRECKLPLLLFALYSVLSLATQVRNIFVVNAIMIFLYLVIRNKKEEGSTIWFSRRMKILVVVSIPILLAFLSFMEYARVGNSYDASPFKLIEAFFENQGGSIRVIGFSSRYRDELLSFAHHYILGPILWIFKYNVVTKIIFGISEPMVGTMSMAQEGNQLAHSLTYLYNPVGYAHGYGIGSCYIAEGYVQYGYIGVIIVSLIVGIICALADKNLYKEKSPIAFSIYFLITAQLIYLPRNSMGSLVSQVFTFTNVIVLLLMHFISKMLNK